MEKSMLLYIFTKKQKSICNAKHGKKTSFDLKKNHKNWSLLQGKNKLVLFLTK
jgi:hypothetical protein